jgi:hypothetical protein
MAATTYKDFYKRYTKGMDDNLAAYDNMTQNYNASVDQNTAAQIADATKSAQGQLRQAYVTRMQDQRSLQDNMARAGIRGGATETANLRLATNYANTRSGIQGQLSNSINDINRTANQNKLAYQQEMDAKKQQYVENRQAEARQAAREDSTQKRTQDIERYTAWASKFFSKKQLQKQLKKANKSGNKLKAQIINARLGYLQSPEYKQAKKAAKY